MQRYVNMNMIVLGLIVQKQFATHALLKCAIIITHSHTINVAMYAFVGFTACRPCTVLDGQLTVNSEWWVVTHVFCASLESLLLKFSSVCSPISYYPNQLPVTLKDSPSVYAVCRGVVTRLVWLAVPYLVSTRCILIVYFVSTDKASDVVVVLQCTVLSWALCDHRNGDVYLRSRRQWRPFWPRVPRTRGLERACPMFEGHTASVVP